jgi:hypothetical protein
MISTIEELNNMCKEYVSNYLFDTPNMLNEYEYISVYAEKREWIYYELLTSIEMDDLITLYWDNNTNFSGVLTAKICYLIMDRSSFQTVLKQHCLKSLMVEYASYYFDSRCYDKSQSYDLMEKGLDPLVEYIDNALSCKKYLK